MSIEVGRIGELGQKNTDTEGLYRSACRKSLPFNKKRYAFFVKCDII